MKAKEKADTVKEWFSEKEAAVYTGLSVTELKRLRYDGKIQFRKRYGGKSITYRRSYLDKAMEDNYEFHNAVPVDIHARRFRNYK